MNASALSTGKSMRLADVARVPAAVTATMVARFFARWKGFERVLPDWTFERKNTGKTRPKVQNLDPGAH